MLQPTSYWILAAVAAALIVIPAYRLRALSTSGAISATILGTTVVGTGGWMPGVVLVAFFASSSLLSRSARPAEPQARGSRRDWVQVLANGWALLVGSVLYSVSDWEPWLLFGIGAISAATADTWSSELGRKSPSPPRLITTGKVVAPGTSGAISLYGSLAALAGALLIAILASAAVALAWLPMESHGFVVLAGITLAGIGGAMLDSILGATVQEQRWCDSCNTPTEADPHRCGSTTRQFRGITGFNNDVVNMFCVLAGALIGLVSGIL